MNYDISSIINKNIKKGEFRNFENIFFSFFIEEELAFERSHLYEKNKNNIERAARNKIVKLMIKLAKNKELRTSFQFQIFDINQFEAFHKLYPMKETIEIKEMKGQYNYRFCKDSFDEWFSMGSLLLKIIFKDYYHFHVNDFHISLEDISKDCFVNDNALVTSHSGDDDFIVFKNGIYFEKTKTLYFFYNNSIIYKNFELDKTSLYLDGELYYEDVRIDNL